MWLKPTVSPNYFRQLKQTAKLGQTALLRKAGFLKQLKLLPNNLLYGRFLLNCSTVELAPKSRMQWFVLESTKFHLVSF